MVSQVQQVSRVQQATQDLKAVLVQLELWDSREVLEVLEHRVPKVLGVMLDSKEPLVNQAWLDSLVHREVEETQELLAMQEM